MGWCRGGPRGYTRAHFRGKVANYLTPILAHYPTGRFTYFPNPLDEVGAII